MPFCLRRKNQDFCQKNYYPVSYLHPNKTIYFQDLGLVPYKEAWDFQEAQLKTLVEQKIQASAHGKEPVTTNHLYFCEHPHVYTLGKSGKENNLLITDERRHKINADYFQSNRGGDITYHGPGQLVAYPIFDLEHFFTDIHLYMRSLEEVVIQTCATFGVHAGRSKGFTGVWLDVEGENPRKICAMGVRTSRWVTMHGLALNVNTDLTYFGHIVPCGIEDKQVTSLHKELGQEVDLGLVKSVMREKFIEVFKAQLEFVS